MRDNMNRIYLLVLTQIITNLQHFIFIGFKDNYLCRAQDIIDDNLSIFDIGIDKH